MPVLDHILWGAPDLDAAVDAFSAVTGLVPSGGGAHPGFGTRNQLLALGPDIFFEIIAPDPAQTDVTSAPRRDKLAARPVPSMYDFCLAEPDLDGFAETAAAQGVGVSGIVSMSRTRPDGVTLNWRGMHLVPPAPEIVLPFLIDWQGSPHPAGTAPGGAGLTDFAVLSPVARKLSALYAALGIDTPVRAAPLPGFIAVLDTPEGEVVLT